MISIAIVPSIAILLLDTYLGRNFRYRPALKRLLSLIRSLNLNLNLTAHWKKKGPFRGCEANKKRIVIPDKLYVWQAELTFIHNRWYPQFKLLIPTIRIIDMSKIRTVDISRCAELSNPYRQFQLLTSANRIVDINNVDIYNSKYWYGQFRWLISTIWNVDINNLNCW